MLAKTLVHKAAMPVALHAVRTFAACCDKHFQLEIHTDGSLDDTEVRQLTAAADDLQTTIIDPPARQEHLAGLRPDYPQVAGLLERGGYMSKMQVLAIAEEPFFYFDSDIVWLHPFQLQIPDNTSAIFSTETWSWYNGIRKPLHWIKRQVPARVNSGFTYLKPPFPFELFEQMLTARLYNPDHKYSTDQEILAYLYKDCRLFRLDQLVRSRVGAKYQINEHQAVALHFPGGMWKPHLQQIENYQIHSSVKPVTIALTQPEPLSMQEYLRLRTIVMIEENWLLHRIANQLRRLRSWGQ